MITVKDFEQLGFTFGKDNDAASVLSTVKPENRGVYKAMIVHAPNSEGTATLFGPIRLWPTDALCSTFPTIDDLYAFLIQETLMQGVSFTQLAEGDFTP